MIKHTRIVWVCLTILWGWCLKGELVSKLLSFSKSAIIISLQDIAHLILQYNLVPKISVPSKSSVLDYGCVTIRKQHCQYAKLCQFCTQSALAPEKLLFWSTYTWKHLLKGSCNVRINFVKTENAALNFLIFCPCFWQKRKAFKKKASNAHIWKLSKQILWVGH